MTPAYIKERITNAPNLDFGIIFNESIELFKKSIVHGFVMQIILMIIIIPVFLLFYMPLVMGMMTQSEYGGVYTDINDIVLETFSFLSIATFLAGMVLIGMIGFLLGAGFLRMLRLIDEDTDVNTKDLFYFFKGKYLGKMFLLMLLTIIITSLAILLCVIPIFYVIVPLSYLLCFLAFNPDLKVGEIVSLSFLLGNKKWLISFGLLIVCYFLATLIGFLLCGIGTLFTAPFVYHPLYIIYKKVVGFEEVDQKEGFKQSFVKNP